jgi:hypothetical protein
MDIIEGVSVISVGEAKGHGLFVDATTLQEVKAMRGKLCRRR